MTRRYDRTGEPYDDDEVPPGHEELCIDGWLPDAPDGSAVPCLTCRPHLAGARNRLLRRLEGPVR